MSTHKQGVFCLAGCMWLCGAFLPTSAATAAVTLESSFNVSQMYTDNLFYEDKNTKSDLGTWVGPNLVLKFENPDIVIGGTYFGRFVLFVNNPDQNRYIQNANFILDLPFLTKRYKGLTVEIDEDMRFTPQLDAFSLSGAQDASTTFNGRGASTSIEGGTGGTGSVSGTGSSQGIGGTQGVFTTRASAFLNNSGITLGYAWTPQVTSYLSYNNQYRHFFSSGFQDSVTHTGTFSVPYVVSEQATVTPSYSYRQTDFLGQSTQGASANKIITHLSYLKVSYNFTPLVTGNIHGGIALTKEIGAEEFDSGTTTNLSNKWQANYIGGATIAKKYRNGEIYLTARQTIGSGGGLASQATRTRLITGRIGHDFSQRLNAFGSVGYAQNTSTEGNAFDTNTYRIQAGIGYVFLSWLSGVLSYSHIDQNSNGSAADDLKVNQVFLGLTAFADPWILMR